MCDEHGFTAAAAAAGRGARRINFTRRDRARPPANKIEKKN